MAGVDLPFACDCNVLRGTLLDVSPRNGNRTDCYCHDCRSAEVFAGQPDPAPGPVGIFQTTPDRVRFDAGLDQLAVFSFSETGILRWQAQCCGATLFNTLRRPKIAFAAFRTDRLSDDSPLGPVVTRAFVRKANGKRGHEGFGRSLLGLVSNAGPALITGRWKKTPFFDLQTGTPVREVYVVSAAERAALDLPKR
ncbi:DUF6151 family protein [uncultured Tateyamaria sp.]|uniref:DUF6151 family protein n=1 Tax=uncultured Tateyamaria sp. TaxID=455651 RepID=UPI00262BAA2A|nr:DUF6151 family protein [uncultured Tateyamaria sp.]